MRDLRERDVGQVARRLGAPLDVFVVRKLGFPGHEELAMGAIASGGVRVLNPEVVAYGVSRAQIEQVTEKERLIRASTSLVASGFQGIQACPRHRYSPLDSSAPRCRLTACRLRIAPARRR